MTVVSQLVSAASVPSTSAEISRIRALTLANLAAACGLRGDANAVLKSACFNSDSPGDRAYRMGVLLHARTQDDFFPRGRCHPGAVSLAAALGLGGAVEGRLLESLAIGYRVTCLVSEAYASSAQQRGLRPTGVFGALGGAAMAARAIGLDQQGIASAIALAAAHSGGTNQAWISGSQEWLTQVGVASRLAVESALMVKAGVESAPDALEGASGFSAALFGDEDAGSLRASLGSGQSADLIAAVAVKPYPISGIAQVPTDLAIDLHRQLSAGKDDSNISAIVVRMNPAEASYPGTDNQEPVRTRAAALMSIRHCVACGLLDGKIGLDRLEHPEMSDLNRLSGMVEVQADPRLEETEAVLEVSTGNRTLESHGHGSKLLYPSWDDLDSDIAGLASRSEASEKVVQELRSKLAAGVPDVMQLRLTIEEEVIWPCRSNR